MQTEKENYVKHVITLKPGRHIMSDVYYHLYVPINEVV